MDKWFNLDDLTDEQLRARRESAYHLTCNLCAQTELLRDDDMIRTLYSDMKKLLRDADEEINRRAAVERWLQRAQLFREIH